MKLLFILLLLLIITIIFYLSWLPEPRLSNIWFIPKFLGKWADEKNNDAIRMAVPFFILGLITAAFLGFLKSHWQWWLIAWAVLLIIACIAEAGQLYLPHRSADIRDVFWGGAGALCGIFAVAAIVVIRKQIFFVKPLKAES